MLQFFFSPWKLWKWKFYSHISSLKTLAVVSFWYFSLFQYFIAKRHFSIWWNEYNCIEFLTRWIKGLCLSTFLLDWTHCFQRYNSGSDIPCPSPSFHCQKILSCTIWKISPKAILISRFTFNTNLMYFFAYCPLLPFTLLSWVFLNH